MLVHWWPLSDGPLERSRVCMIALFFDMQLKVQFFWLFHISAIVFFIIPLVVLIVLYSFIAITIEQSYVIAKSWIQNYCLACR